MDSGLSPEALAQLGLAPGLSTLLPPASLPPYIGGMRIEANDPAARYAAAAGHTESIREREHDGDRDDAAAVAARSPLQRASPLPPEMGTKVDVLA